MENEEEEESAVKIPENRFENPERD